MRGVRQPYGDPPGRLRFLHRLRGGGRLRLSHAGVSTRWGREPQAPGTLTGGEPDSGGDVHARRRFVRGTLALPAAVGDARYNVAQRDTFGVFNARLGLETDNYHVVVFAENLFDKKYIAEAIPAIEFGGSFISPGGRRLIGVEAGVKF